MLKRFQLASFTILVSECTAEDRKGCDPARDAMVVEIRHKQSKQSLRMVVQSGICGTFSEEKAARTGISFATCSTDWDNPKDMHWVREFGEDLGNEACCHRVLGKED